MDDLIGYANDCDANERIIILDCCHAGAIDREFASGGQGWIAEGVTILIAARNNEFASESADAGGLFTSLITGGLRGGAADPITGAITVADLFAYVDGAVSPLKNEQPPIFKANLASFTMLREMDPVPPRRVVHRLPEIFSAPEEELPLDPKYEPTSKGKAEPRKETDYTDRQQMRAANLVEPLGEAHMYYAAVNRTSCRLTPLGAYYWQLVKSNRF